MSPLKNHLFVISSLFLGLVVVALVIFARPSLVHPAPTVTWTPSNVTETVAQGGQKTKVVSFVSNQNLTNIGVWVVPELQPYVSAAPSSFSSVNAGTQVTITLTFSASATTPLQTFDGTIHLRDNGGRSRRTYAQPLPVTINICRCVEEKGLFLTYPSAWQVRSAPDDRVISLRTFGSYKQGGFIPPSGAAISISTTPLPTSPLNAFITENLQGRAIESVEAAVVAGQPATKAVFSDFRSPDVEEQNIVFYVPRGTLLYYFFLSYNSGDVLETQFRADFQQILNSVQFTE